MAILPSENPRIVKYLTRGYASLRTLVTRGVFYDSRILRWQNRCSTPTLAADHCTSMQILVLNHLKHNCLVNEFSVKFAAAIKNIYLGPRVGIY
jgi:hypothetical protein